ncbi:CaiB/BaiF CoA-transferase family protein [Acuticoccus sp. MNP-M23]|uniref:CaiB/BaiF CoA transferase family protein n=1 Tax=Acuticoccus sp. MNP-M23 TaxID=3072793 RepID=UPI00281657D3|nr:CaiB/BaiF CoA-transferase family protein [Acuticoccus sp. MNP-M23]WMS40876.1 CaiB/BaiF CoA-transferase family protein [Acuticoccus sp. MNP-M23]
MADRSDPAAAPTGPLSGILVLDLSRILAGPTATQLLGDLGADIIKIERFGVGDDTRRWGPPFLTDENGRETAESAYYLAANRNKRSLALDLSKPEGQDIVRAIAAKADMAIENFKVGGAARMGLDYAALSTINPKLIYASVTGYGQTGPLASHAGYDFMAQGRGGIMSVTGEADDKGGTPQKVGVGIADVMTGMYAAVAMLAALQGRSVSGRGQYIDLSLFDTQLAWLINQGASFLMSGDTPIRRGNGHPTIVPYNAFPASDGMFILAIGNDGQFAKFCAAAGEPGIATDPRFATNAARVRNRDAVEANVARLTAQRTRAEWMAVLAPLGVPIGPINTIPEAFAEPQAAARGAVVTHDHPAAADGIARTIGNPIKMSDTPVDYRRRPPMRGEHSREVLTELLGMDDDAIDALAKAGVVDLGDLAAKG